MEVKKYLEYLKNKKEQIWKEINHYNVDKGGLYRKIRIYNEYINWTVVYLKNHNCHTLRRLLIKAIYYGQYEYGKTILEYIKYENQSCASWNCIAVDWCADCMPEMARCYTYDNLYEIKARLNFISEKVELLEDIEAVTVILDELVYYKIYLKKSYCSMANVYLCYMYNMCKLLSPLFAFLFSGTDFLSPEI